jgi:hypothetical protein
MKHPIAYSIEYFLMKYSIGYSIEYIIECDKPIDRFHSRDRWPQWGGETIRNI